MKTIAVYLKNEPYPKQGGMERVTDVLLRMLAERYKVLIICEEKNRLGEVYVCPVPIYFLSRTPQERRLEFISILQQNNVNVLIDQVEGGVIGRYGIFRKRNELALLGLKCMAVQHNSAMSVLKNYNLVKQRQGLPSPIGWVYNTIVLAVLKKRAYWLQEVLFVDLNANYDKIITLSTSFIPHFYRLAPHTPEGKVVAISNPNTYEDPVATGTSTMGNEKMVLFVGRLDNKAKGVDRLLRIWSIVEARTSGWTLKIVGDGQDRKMLKDLAGELGLKQVSFEGFRVPKSYYERASIFCMTSTFEGFGVVLTEAMQHGVVPMAFNSYDALQDIVTNGEDGVVVPAFDEQSYAESLLLLMSNPSLLKRMSAQAKLSSDKFSRDKIAQKWYNLIDTL